MSSTILYRPMFVKLSDGTFIPMSEVGESNCYDLDGKRARDWESLRWCSETDEEKMKLSFTEKEIISIGERKVRDLVETYAHGEVTERDVMQRFSYYSAIRIYGQSNSTASQFINFLRKGISNAVPVTWIGNFTLMWWDKDNRFVETVTDEEALRARWNELRRAGKTLYVGMPSYIADDLWRTVHGESHRVTKRRLK